MQIFEVTGPGSVVGQAGVFGRALGQALLQKAAPGIVGTERDAPVPQTGGQPAPEITAPVMQRLVDAQHQLWTQNLLDLMRRTQNRGTKEVGVVSMRDVPRPDLERLVMAQVGDTLRTLTQGRVSDFRQLPGMVPDQSRGDAQLLVTNIKRGLGQLLSTEPSTANNARIKVMWRDLLSNLEKSAQLTQFRTQNLGGSTRIVLPGGQVLDPNNANDARVISALQAQGAV